VLRTIIIIVCFIWVSVSIYFTLSNGSITFILSSVGSFAALLTAIVSKIESKKHKGIQDSKGHNQNVTNNSIGIISGRDTNIKK